MSNLKIKKDTVAYKAGRQAFHDGLDILDDNPYNVKNMFSILPAEWFAFYQGHMDAYIESLDD